MWGNQQQSATRIGGNDGGNSFDLFVRRGRFFVAGQLLKNVGALAEFAQPLQRPPDRRAQAGIQRQVAGWDVALLAPRDQLPARGTSSRAGAVASVSMPLEADVRAALTRSHFRVLPEEVLARLAFGAVRVQVPAGTELIAPCSVPRLLLMVSGVGKTYLIAPNGRQATVRYARAGDIVAATVAYEDRPTLPGFRTLTASTVLIFNMESVRALTRTDVRVANVFNVEMAERLSAYFAELAGTTFGSLRERVIRHLLDVASEQQRGPTLVARLSQQELADAVGSVREVVGRVLGKLRDEGLLRTHEGELELLEPARLAEEAPAAVTRVTRAGDQGR